MAVTPDDLLRAATEMGQRDSEVHWRSAASRAYYAAYHRCRQMAMAERLEVQEGGSQHVALATALERGPNAPIRRIGYILDSCRLLRSQADYDIDQRFSRQLGDTVLANCREILAAADRI